MSDEKQPKHEALRTWLGGLDALAVAFSGGVDSTFLLKVAHDVLGRRALAITVAAAVHPRAELDEARQIASEIGARHEIVEVDALAMPAFQHNPPDRCYRCKREVFTRIKETAAVHGIAVVADGTNADDMGDDRPGLRALEELGVVAPLRDAGLTKAEIRELSRDIGLPTWDKPAYACLATRFPHGAEITADALQRVERAEAALQELGFKLSRVRHHGDVARIEVAPADVARIAAPETAAEVTAKLRAAGFRYVTLDLEGYRVGSMSEGGGKDDR